MSNFVLNPKTHSKIANLFYRAVEYGFNNVGFDLSGKIKDEVRSCLDFYPHDLEEAIYRALYIANLRAQAQAYSRNRIDKNNLLIIPSHKSSTFGIGCSETKNDCQALKSIDCYLYNSDCEDTEDMPIIRAAKKIGEALRRKIIAKLDDYKAADWG